MRPPSSTTSPSSSAALITLLAWSLFSFRSGSPSGWRTPARPARVQSRRECSRSRSMRHSKRRGVMGSWVNMLCSCLSPQFRAPEGADAFVGSPEFSALVELPASGAYPVRDGLPPTGVPAAAMHRIGVQNHEVFCWREAEGRFPARLIGAKTVDTVWLRIGTEGFATSIEEPGDIRIGAGEAHHVPDLARAPQPSR